MRKIKPPLGAAACDPSGPTACDDPDEIARRALARVVDHAEYSVDPQKRVAVKLQLLGGAVVSFALDPIVARDMSTKLVLTLAKAMAGRETDEDPHGTRALSSP